MRDRIDAVPPLNFRKTATHTPLVSRLGRRVIAMRPESWLPLQNVHHSLASSPPPPPPATTEGGCVHGLQQS